MAEQSISQDEVLANIPINLNVTTELLDKHVSRGLANKVAYYQLNNNGELVGSIKYRELLENASRFGSSLRKLGLREEERVLIIMPDTIEAITAFLGTIRMGGIAALINFKLTKDDYLYAANLIRARALITDIAHFDVATELLQKVRSMWRVIIAPAPGEKVPNDVIKSVKDISVFNDFLNEGSPELEPADTHRDDPAFILLTSGTTGKPKAVVHKHGDILYIADTLGKYIINMREDDIVFSTSKLFFAYGFGYILAFPLRVGASVILYPDLIRPELALKVIDNYKPTIFASSPAFYRAMLLTPDADKYNLSSIRCASSAGEVLPAAVYEQFYKKFGIKIFNCYGSTEALHCFIVTRPDSKKFKPGSAADTVVPGYEIKIVDPQTGEEIKESNKQGVLYVKGYSNALLIMRDYEKYTETFGFGWWNSGDIVYRDEDGVIWFVARADDMIKQGGVWISPYEVEDALLQHPAVKEAAVVGYKDSEGLMHAKAFIVLKPGYQPSEELINNIKEFLRNKIAHYKIPHYFEFVNELPKTTTGKILRRLLRNY